MLVLTSLASAALVIQAVGLAPASSASASPLPSSLDLVAASYQRGTAQDDVISGRITVDQLADAAQANSGSSRGLSQADSAADHARLASLIQAQVAQLRLRGPAPAPADLTIDTDASGKLVVEGPGQPPVKASLDGPSASGVGADAQNPDPLVTSQHWWNRVIHWINYPTFKFNLSGNALKVSASALSALLTGVICAGGGPALCAWAGAIITAVTTYLLVNHCGANGIHIEYPDIQKIHCL